MSANFATAVTAERARQLRQGKFEDNLPLEWKLIVEDQLAMITRTMSLARYEGVGTSSGRLDAVRPEDRGAIKLGLIRLAACAQAWYENL